MRSLNELSSAVGRIYKVTNMAMRYKDHIRDGIWLGSELCKQYNSTMNTNIDASEKEKVTHKKLTTQPRVALPCHACSSQSRKTASYRPMG
jgi:hypothetical protein